MPLYEYECSNCSEHVECIQKVNEAPLVNCPACGKPGLHRLLSAPAFQLKGQGWYVTDFRDNKKSSNKDTSETKPNNEKKDKPAPSKEE